MRTIWKFPIPISEDFTIEMPMQAEVISVGEQDDNAFVWAIVESDAPTEKRRFSVVGTGHHLCGNIAAGYISTFQVGGFVGHLFERMVDDKALTLALAIEAMERGRRDGEKARADAEMTLNIPNIASPKDSPWSPADVDPEK